MDKQTFQIAGSLLLIAGLVLGSVGTFRIFTNLPLSDERALEEARRAVLTEEGITESPGRKSLREDIELHVWTCALKMTNKDRKETRDRGVVLLVSGIFSVIWGTAALYTSSSILNEP